MLKIRLKRVGRKHDPSFRVVLIDSSKGPKSGKINEILGFYDPRKDTKELKAEEIKNWISKGAQVSDTVHNLLVDAGIIEGKKINVLPKKNPIVKEEKEEVKEELTGEKETVPAEDTEDKISNEKEEATSTSSEGEPESQPESDNNKEETSDEEPAEEEPSASTSPEGESESRPEDSVGKENPKEE